MEEQRRGSRVTGAFVPTLFKGWGYLLLERKNLEVVQVFVTALNDLLLNIWTVVRTCVEDT
jgi:hypothetical protein